MSTLPWRRWERKVTEEPQGGQKSEVWGFLYLSWAPEDTLGGGARGGNPRRWGGDEIGGKDLENNTGLRMRRPVLRGLVLGWKSRAAETRVT